MAQESPRTVVPIIYEGGSDLESVDLFGSWDKHSSAIEMVYIGKKRWIVEVELPSGVYHWRFWVKGEFWDTASGFRVRQYNHQDYNVKRVKVARGAAANANAEVILNHGKSKEELMNGWGNLESQLTSRDDPSKKNRKKKRKKKKDDGKDAERFELYERTNRHNEELVKENQEVTKKVEQMEQELEGMKKIVAEHEKLTTKQRGKYQKEKTRVKQLQERAKTLHWEKLKYEAMLDEYTRAKQDIDLTNSKKTKELQEKCDSLTSELKHKDEAMAKLRDSNAKALEDALMDSQKAQMSELAKLREENALLKESLKNTKEELKTSHTSNTQLREQSSASELQIQQMQTKLLQLKTEHADALNDAQKRLQKLGEENITLARAKVDYENQNKKLASRIRRSSNRMSQDLEDMTSSIHKQSNESIKEKFVNTTKENLIYKEQIETLKGENERLSKAHKEEQEGHFKYKAENLATNKMLTDTRSQLQQEQKQRVAREDEIISLKKREMELSGQAQMLTQQLTMREEELAKYQSLAEEHGDSSKTKEEKIVALRTELAKTTEELEIARMDFKTQNNKRKDLELMLTTRSEDAETKQQQLSLQVEQLQNSMRVMKNKAVTFEEERENLLAQVEEKDDALEKLQQALSRTTIEYETNSKAFTSKLQEAEQNRNKMKREVEKHRTLQKSANENYSATKSQVQQTVNMRIQDLRMDIDAIRREKKREFAGIAGFLKGFGKQMTKQLDYNAAQIKEIEEKYKQELKLRRQYFEMVQELRGSIRVFCRVRPSLSEEAPVFAFPRTTRVSLSNKRDPALTYDFAKVFEPEAPQDALQADARDMAVMVLDGYDVALLAFGAPASGKAFTLLGTQQDPGMGRRIIGEMFKFIAKRGKDYKYNITMSAYSITADQISDVLSRSQAKHEVRVSNGEATISNLSATELQSGEDAQKTIERVSQVRNALADAEDMSDSQLVISVVVEGDNLAANMAYRGKLSIVLTGAFHEAIDPNDSTTRCLGELKKVLMAIKDRERTIPNTGSSLTKALQLTARTKTVIFSCCDASEYEDSKSLLEFTKTLAQKPKANGGGRKLRGRGPSGKSGRGGPKPKIKPKFKKKAHVTPGGL